MAKHARLLWLGGDRFPLDDRAPIPRAACAGISHEPRHRSGASVQSFSVSQVDWVSGSGPRPPRFIWSVFSRKPRALDGEGMASRLAARAAHAALLFLTLAVPLAGWAVASTSPLQIPSYVFDLVVVPGLPMAISDQAEAFWTKVHATLAYLAAVIVVLHVAAALWHHFVRKDPTLRRMIPFRAAADNRSRTASPRK